MNRLSESLKSIAARLPDRWIAGLKKRRFASQIRAGKFVTDEPEFDRLGDWVRPGDWALDIGANIGHYALRLSELVGETGRVIAFEPMPASFEILAASAALARWPNISLFQMAASDSARAAPMGAPKLSSGLTDYYRASLEGHSPQSTVLCLSLDNWSWPAPIRLVKIDAEGHEPRVLRGMKATIARDHPLIIVEANSNEPSLLLKELGYLEESLPQSPNQVFRHPDWR